MYKPKKTEKLLNSTRNLHEVGPYKKNPLRGTVPYYNLLQPYSPEIYLKSSSNGFMAVDNFRAVFNYLRFFIKKYSIIDIYIRLRILPLIHLTSKPSEMGMGKGRGDFKGRVFLIKEGQVLCEIGGSFMKNKNFKVFITHKLQKKLFGDIKVVSKF